MTAPISDAAYLRGLLWHAYHEFNAVRARSGAPLNHDGMITCSEEWWGRLTEAFAGAIGDEARTPWPSPEAAAATEHAAFPKARA